MFKAQVIADSVNPTGQRITTMLLRYPRFIHAEFMTHRVFSRNASSSRAIPVSKIIADVEENPVIPVHWGKNQRGMQAREEIEDRGRARAEWLAAAQDAVKHARRLSELGVHKQVVNRILEPFSSIAVLVTATEWDNFFRLRAHPDAQPEMKTLAYCMLDAYHNSRPDEREVGDWHIPFGDRMPEGLSLRDQVRVATARCARLSYRTHDGDVSLERDLELHDRLEAAGHWSPFEHCAVAQPHAGPCANFRGWMSYRMLQGH